MRRAQQATLSEELATPRPPAMAEPITITVPLHGAVFEAFVSAAGAPLMFFGIANLVMGIRYTTVVFVALAVIAVIIALALVLALRGATRALRIDAQGIRIVGIAGDEMAHWYAIERVGVTPDLGAMRLQRTGGASIVELAPLSAQHRRDVLAAVRSRMPADSRDVEEWKRGRSLQPHRVLGGGLAISMVIGFTFFGHDYVGASLGFRCSGPSVYMEQRFDLPHERGCALLGISGAAERVGLRQGDLLIAMDGEPITSGPQFFTRFEDERGNSPFWFTKRTYEFTVLRGGEPQPVAITLHMGPGGGLDLPKDDALYWYRKARADMGEHPKRGIRDYTRAIDLAPDMDLAYLYRGMLRYWDFDDVSGAYADYARTLEINPESPEANRMMGWLWSTGDLAKAMSYAQLAIQYDECDGGFERYNYDCREDYRLLSYIYQRQGDTKAAADASERAVDFYPG
jgi:hypothetical protein